MYRLTSSWLCLQRSNEVFSVKNLYEIPDPDPENPIVGKFSKGKRCGGGEILNKCAVNGI